MWGANAGGKAAAARSHRSADVCAISVKNVQENRRFGKVWPPAE
jgi:hypothetical protein